MKEGNGGKGWPGDAGEMRMPAEVALKSLPGPKKIVKTTFWTPHRRNS
jgi:hypothetical protein